jgi:soluble lytic murein transglycosylase-like protein
LAGEKVAAEFRNALTKLGFFSAALCAAASPARADVLDIAPDGAVSVYSQPTVFTDTAQTPIAPPSRPFTAPPAALAPMLEQAADRAGLHPDLVEAVAWAESRFNTQAVSSKGAIGAMQIMPATAREIGIDAYDVTQNIQGGARYLRGLVDAFDGDVSLALAAYNAGAGAVRVYGGVPPYRETQNYVAAVLGYMADKAAKP